MAAIAGRHRVPTDSPNERAHRRQIATALNGALSGHLDCTTTVTLAANATTTTLTDARIGLTTAALMQPTTADAAAELASGAMYWVASQGVLTITHRNNTQTDRAFVVAFLG